MAFHPSDFEHPTDRTARENLEQVPLLRAAVQKFMKAYDERIVRTRQMTEMLRLGPRQYPRVYRLLPPICDAFGIEEPELFLADGPLNAATFGSNKPSIVLYGGLVGALEDEEIQAVLAHECGHIVCKHVLLKSMADRLHDASRLLPFANALSGPVQGALLSWSRKSELSADRAAAAFMGGAEPMLRVMLRFTGVPAGADPGQFDLDVFARQADEAEKAGSSVWDKIIGAGRENSMTHPILATRVRELRSWTTSEAFRRLSEVARKSADQPRCDGCGRGSGQDRKFCQHCGRQLCESS